MNTRQPVQTYQQSLDQALEETFPASDPISASAAGAQDDPVQSPGNPIDWRLAGAEGGASSRPGTSEVSSILLGAAAGAFVGRLAGGRTRLGALIGATVAMSRSRRATR
jgi:hypothetical protein